MKRESYMDFLKGIAILAVIIGHSISDIENLTVPFNIIYSFHMPLLIFISAYIEEKYRNKYENQMRKMLLKRAFTLLVPYISWTIISILISGGNLYLNYDVFLNSLLGYAKTALWFLPVLFGLKCMHFGYWYLQSKFGNQNILIQFIYFCVLESVILLLAICTRHPFIINMLSYAIPYFAGVIIIGNEKVKTFIGKQWIVTTAIVIYVILFQFFSFYNTSWITQVLRICLSLCVIIICCEMQKGWQNNNIIKEFLCKIGRYSLEIYLLHNFILDYKVIIEGINSTFCGTVLAIFFSIGVAIVCIALAKVLSVSLYMKKILFGK